MSHHESCKYHDLPHHSILGGFCNGSEALGGRESGQTGNSYRSLMDTGAALGGEGNGFGCAGNQWRVDSQASDNSIPWAGKVTS